MTAMCLSTSTILSRRLSRLFCLFFFLVFKDIDQWLVATVGTYVCNAWADKISRVADFTLLAVWSGSLRPIISPVRKSIAYE